MISFSDDWLFTPEQSRAIVNALAVNRKDVSFYNIESSYGHDAFLLDNNILGDFISGFLRATHRPQPGPEKKREPLSNKRIAGHVDLGRRTRVDYELIESLIAPDSTVLDVGCGDGELLARLSNDKNITPEGIEVEQDLVLACVNRALPVIGYDIERGLGHYKDKSFDYVILSQTVQTLKDPEKVFTELLRIGRKVIVSFPNFANWRCRLDLAFSGKAPVTGQLPFEWHNSPNIHFLSLKDFDSFCERLSVKVEQRIPLIKNRLSPVRFAPNLFAEQVIYVTSKD